MSSHICLLHSPQVSFWKSIITHLLVRLNHLDLIGLRLLTCNFEFICHWPGPVSVVILIFHDWPYIFTAETSNDSCSIRLTPIRIKKFLCAFLVLSWRGINPLRCIIQFQILLGWYGVHTICHLFWRKILTIRSLYIECLALFLCHFCLFHSCLHLLFLETFYIKCRIMFMPPLWIIIESFAFHVIKLLFLNPCTLMTI